MYAGDLWRRSEVKNLGCLKGGPNSGTFLWSGLDWLRAQLQLRRLEGDHRPAEWHNQTLGFRELQRLSRFIRAQSRGLPFFWSLQFKLRLKVTCVEHYEYHKSNYLASASMATDIKMWDIRKKGVLLTYGEHEAAVSCIRFRYIFQLELTFNNSMISVRMAGACCQATGTELWKCGICEAGNRLRPSLTQQGR